MSDEILIRQAIAEEANQAVDASTVLANLRKARKPRRRSGFAIAIAGVAVAAGVVAVVVPLISARDNSLATPGNAVLTQPAPSPTAQNILLAGTDGSARTDTLLLVHRRIDGSFQAVSLPRDTLVTVPQRGQAKLNAAYAMGSKSPDSPGFDPDGAKTLVATVEQLTGTKVDHFAMVDMNVFGHLAEAIGGVEVCLRQATKDTVSGANLAAGKQVLAGDQMLAFLRQRHGLPNGDLDRVARQQAFLRALIIKLAGHKDFTALMEIVKANVRIDEGWNVLDFANQLVAGADVTTATIPITNVDVQMPNGGSAIGADPAAVQKFVGEFFAGRPAPGSAPTPSGDGCVN
jgi:LCP family protein required for cell wall assembly